MNKATRKNWTDSATRMLEIHEGAFSVQEGTDVHKGGLELVAKGLATVEPSTSPIPGQSWVTFRGVGYKPQRWSGKE